MEVTPIGWVCILVGLHSIGRPRRLAWLLCFSTIFSATAVINFPSIPYGFQPYHWFGTLLVGSPFLVGRPADASAASGGPVVQVELLVGFVFWGMLASVASGAGAPGLVHMAHIIFGLSVLTALKSEVRAEPDLRSLIGAVVWGAAFAALWGIIQFSLFLLGVEYPAMLFNNSVGESAAGFESTVAGGFLPRLSSVATEPSYLVRSLVTACVLLTVLLTLEPERTPPVRRMMVGTAWLLAVVTVLSTSTLGIMGLLLTLVWLSVVVPPARAAVMRVCLIATPILGFLFYTEPLMASVAEEVLFGKVELGSGEVRADSVAEAFEVFTRSPVFGGGPGVTTSHDLLVKLLSNFGLVGALLFAAALTTSLVHAARRYHSSPLVAALALSNAILWCMDGVAGVSYQYGVFWVLLAFLLASLRGGMSESPLAVDLVR